MKTYSETQGQEPFDWNKALNARKKDWHYLEIIAGLWVTCACGNQCDAIPRDNDGCPEDNILRYLGVCFMNAIERHKTQISKEILEKIEYRSSELINEIYNK